jgi:predicted enzyme related to lactoylglutathione lyase
VNQPLSGIVMNASTCRRMLDSDPPNIDGARETARRTIRDGNRASEVVTRLRTLFKRKEVAAEPIDLNEAAREVLALSLSELQSNRIAIRQEFAENLPLTRCNDRCPPADTGSQLESSMSAAQSLANAVKVGQSSFEMPPKQGINIAHLLTVANIARSARYYEKVFGGRILSLGDSKGASGHIQFSNTWLIVNVGGGPTPDKPTVTLSVTDPNRISSFLNIRVADIQACYELWKSRGAEFITPPIPKYGEIRCYIRDPDAYIIEVGQSTDLTSG